MLKKMVVMSLPILLFTQLSAYDLKSNMIQLGAELAQIQKSFIASDQEGVEDSIKNFSKHAQELLGNKDSFSAMLPKDKRYKASEAVMSAQIISHNVKIILDAIENKNNQSGIVRREESQRAYTYIEHACFRCHNIVRDEY
ncbi:MAG: hypothetical protein AUK54_09535 [Helicobacteraceae bacterium CG2_30_36_10]|nr:MAG: hypothetical protein AUK54_09535 [Helicobacteraceae bacterium CG2_30_36_10]